MYMYYHLYYSYAFLGIANFTFSFKGSGKIRDQNRWLFNYLQSTIIFAWQEQLILGIPYILYGRD